MTRWEYAIKVRNLHGDHTPTVEALVAWLDELGAQGWELVQDELLTASLHRYTFKRPVPEPSVPATRPWGWPGTALP